VYTYQKLAKQKVTGIKNVLLWGGVSMAACARQQKQE
jgi:hypothetical protein